MGHEGRKKRVHLKKRRASSCRKDLPAWNILWECGHEKVLKVVTAKKKEQSEKKNEKREERRRVPFGMRK